MADPLSHVCGIRLNSCVMPCFVYRVDFVLLINPMCLTHGEHNNHKDQFQELISLGTFLRKIKYITNDVRKQFLV